MPLIGMLLAHLDSMAKMSLRYQNSRILTPLTVTSFL